jgi:hypothetical protein
MDDDFCSLEKGKIRERATDIDTNAKTINLLPGWFLPPCFPFYAADAAISLFGGQRPAHLRAQG